MCVKNKWSKLKVTCYTLPFGFTVVPFCKTAPKSVNNAHKLIQILTAGTLILIEYTGNTSNLKIKAQPTQ